MANEYKRKPIVLNHQTIMMIQMFKRRDNVIEDLWIDDYICEQESFQDDCAIAAEQFFKQLEGEECGAFVMALIKESFKNLKEHDDFAGTKWVKENIKEIKKIYASKQKGTG